MTVFNNPICKFYFKEMLCILDVYSELIIYMYLVYKL